MTVLLLSAAVAGAAVVTAVLYNGLVRKRNRVEEAWSQIDVQLTRRHDLIPNLVETVKGYAAHESGVFQAVTEARARAVGAGSVGEKAEAEAGLTGALRSLFAVAENYPQLQASANFLALQEELTATEDRVAYSRQYYNAAVRVYDTATETFPGVLVAKKFGFEEREYFEVEDAAVRAVPKVGF